VATGEKALLDLLYLTPGSDDPAYLAELRLQDLANLDVDAMGRMARLFTAPRIERAVKRVSRLLVEGSEMR
jgi:hypothetical protein